MLIVHFAKDSARPIVSALVRLCIGFAGSLVLSMSITKGLKRLILPTDFPLSFLICLSIGLGFIFSGFTLLLMGMSHSVSSKTQIFEGITKLMPLPRSTRWLLAIMPAAIILMVIGIFGGVIINELATILQTRTLFVELGWILGLFSGYGCMIGRWPRNAVAKGITFIAIVICGFVVFDKIFATQSEDVRTLLLVLLYTIFTFPVFGFIDSYFHGIDTFASVTQKSERALIPASLPHSSWFFIKLWRNRRTRAAFLMAATFSSSGAVGIVIQHKPVQNPYQILILGAVLAATFACDVRGVMRRYVPPEIVLLKGTYSIVSVEVLSVLLLGVILGCPMFMALHTFADNQLRFLVFYFAVQIYSSLSGLCASTLLVPGPGDTGSQFFAATLACFAITMAPRIGHFSNIDYYQQVPYWLTASVLIGVVIYITEIIRRRNYGRS